MEKIKKLIFVESFWLWFVGGALGIYALETFFLGLWTMPVIQYRISYMGDITAFDMVFAIVYALVFGFGLSVFILARRFNAASCATGSASGLLAFFTMLCPVCPIFFLSYFGLSASVIAFAPFFWWLRFVSFALLGVGIVLLWKQFVPRDVPKVNGHLLFQKSAIVVIAALLIGNQALAMQMGNTMLGGGSSSGGLALTGDFALDVAALVTPSEMPFYGQELGLDMTNLNKINASIRKLGVMAPKQGSNPIQLNEEQMKRYIKIGTEPYITCEFCCGVKTLVREDGSPTCGCAHSIAMRGTAAYLIQNYPDMSDEDIAYELVRQKGLYFPTQLQERMARSLAGNVAEFKPDIKYLTMNLSAAELSDLQDKAKNSGFIPQDNPGMVGGC